MTQYEVEAQQRGRKRRLLLRVSVIRGPRGRKKMQGECHTRTNMQPRIHFKVSGGDNEEGIYQDFLALLLHRGFLPLRYRVIKDDSFGDWETASLEGLDAKAVLEQEGKAVLQQ